MSTINFFIKVRQAASKQWRSSREVLCNDSMQKSLQGCGSNHTVAIFFVFFSAHSTKLTNIGKLFISVQHLIHICQTFATFV